MIIEMLTGGGLVGVGVLLGCLLFVWGRSPRCCEHSFGMHDLATGACRVEIVRRKYVQGSHVGEEYVRCSCLHYDGPRPRKFHYTPEITER